MCDRYVRKSGKQRIAEVFQVVGDLSSLSMPDANYNIAPDTHQPIIRESKVAGLRELVLARWGLIPFHTKSLTDVKGLSTINASAESIATSKTWRLPVKKRRCLVPASAFYEWPKDSREPKQPYTFEMQNGSMFAFAGLWDAWKDAHGHWLQSFTIVTTVANELMSRIHPRMPVILHARDYDRWLDRGETQQLPLDLLRPYEAEDMEMYEANPLVGNVWNNGPEMLHVPKS